MAEAIVVRPTSRKRLIAVLGLMGVAGFLAALPYFGPMLSAAADRVHKPLALLIVAQALQVGVLCGLAALAGAFLAPRAGFDAPWLRALVERRPLPRIDVARAIAFGTLATAFTVGALLAVRPWAPAVLWKSAGDASFLRGASSAFYGGVVEEILMRWGLLSLLMLAFRRHFWPANIAAALLFGAGHLPAALQMGLPPTAGLFAHVLLGNAVAGLFFGAIYRRSGLESAMIAHATADVWLHAILPHLS